MTIGVSACVVYVCVSACVLCVHACVHACMPVCVRIIVTVIPGTLIMKLHGTYLGICD